MTEVLTDSPSAEASARATAFATLVVAEAFASPCESRVDVCLTALSSGIESSLLIGLWKAFARASPTRRLRGSVARSPRARRRLLLPVEARPAWQRRRDRAWRRRWPRQCLARLVAASRAPHVS